MQSETHKKKKGEPHKVTLNFTKKTQLAPEPVPNTENAYFPFTPYPEQAVLMNTIHNSILNKQNALIESPTGTGKTLCILVGSLSSLCSLTANEDKMKVPKIYYLTRTHSQITQVVQELKRIPWYQCRINIIASREHLCINRNLKQLKGRVLDQACQQMCKQKMCKFKEEAPEQLPAKDWFTVEELKEQGSRNDFCPFYYTKMMAQKSEITIMPFNYLMDWNLMERNSFNLKNSVIVFDEAHNIDSLAEEGSSLQIDSDIVFQALTQVKNLQQSSKCRYLHKKFEAENDSSDYSCVSQAKKLLMRMNSVMKQFVSQKNMTSLEEMLAIIKRLTNFVDQDKQFTGIDLNNYEQIIFNLDRVKKLFNSKKIEGDQFQTFLSALTKVMKLLQSNSSYLEDYYMYIGQKNTKSHTLKLNCLNGSFTFQRLTQQKPRSIILCSGTLGPFEIWQKQLGLAFANKLRVPSFITRNQICIDIVSNSSDKNRIKYQFSYQNKNKQQMYQSFGDELKQIEKNVPNGIIVAFSTYELMQKAMKYCMSLKKSIFYESKNQSIDVVYPKYIEAAKTKRGSFLFIVMKGKFAQGINFSNELCRCLVVVGIPFLPPNDYRVMRKKLYVEGKFGKDESEKWYYCQTFKTVNQVIGRVIRSKTDYGSVLLFDHRYARKDIIKELPVWFSANLQQIQFRPSHYLSKLKDFFQNQPWKKDALKQQSSFQILLEKISSNPEGSKKISLEALLLQKTPVKIVKTNKPKRTLKIQQEQSEKANDSQNQYTNTSNILKQLDNPQIEQKKDDSMTKQKPKKTMKCPWFSIDYFLLAQEQQTKKLKASDPPKQIQNQSAKLTVVTSAVRKKKYL